MTKKQEDGEFKDSLGYRARLVFQNDTIEK